MSRREDIERKTEELLLPILAESSCELVDVEYVKEGGDMILRAYIDREGGVRIDDCEAVSRALSVRLDEADLIAEAYTLEVSSPGLLRPIRKDKDFARNRGREVELRLFRAKNGEKEFIGTLTDYDPETVTLTVDGETRSFARSDISLLRPYIDFSELLK
ncbi:MAG: ribosome maturation factor RimP [Lachnospiraceae bacterium]|nr:ribosome maturation factor RimP [Lachnospiraceae bacterium]